MTIQRITAHSAHMLHDAAATRRMEQRLASTLPPHTLMQRAGLAVAKLAMALEPHARLIWVACGPGNNGGDGLVAATHLRQRGYEVHVSWIGNIEALPPDAKHAHRQAQACGISISDSAPPHFDLAIDALLGLGTNRAPEGHMAAWLQLMYGAPATVLSVDLPSGLDADTGNFFGPLPKPTSAQSARHCLTFLTLKPGLFTAHGRDIAGQTWFASLGSDALTAEPPIAQLNGAFSTRERAHASHKGTYGDVTVVGGAPGMAGAALLAAMAALHAGAGRVYVGLLDPMAASLASAQPELMVRDPASLDMSQGAVVCGCGGGELIGPAVTRAIHEANRLVLDADALNHVAANPSLQRDLEQRAQRGQATVLTPHPLEAARLLGIPTAEVQANRLRTAQRLSARFGITVLKGSGTLIGNSHSQPFINLSGNAKLATAGTGDVLAGMIGAALSQGASAELAAREAVWRHGGLADRWPDDSSLTASALARGQLP